MRNVFTVALIVAMAAMAGGEFSTGGADLLTFKGYVIGTFNMYGEELADGETNNDFDILASIEWLPVLNDWVDAKIAFKALPTKYTGSYEDLSLTTEDIAIFMHFTENMTFSMGHFKRPFCYNYTRSGSSMYFRDRAMLADIIGDFGKRDIGANLNADFGVVNIDLSYTNGEGDNEPEDDDLKNFTARAIFEPMPGINVAAAFGTNSEYSDSTNQESYSATGLDFYATAEIPLGPASDMFFAGEYMMLGDPEVDPDADYTDANAYAVTLMANFDLEGEMLQAVRPAIRYENVSPGYAGEDDPENDVSAIDFCLNLDLYSSKNTAQIGMRNYSGQNDDFEGYTDMYLGWRMKF